MDDYSTFIRDSDKPWCWACGRDRTNKPADWFAPWFMQRAHVASGGSVRRRVEDVRAINILCPLCHSLHHGAVVRVQGITRPKLNTPAMLWLKRERDPDNWDPAFLQGIWLGVMPEPAEPNDWFIHEYDTRRKIGWKNWW